MNRLFLISEFSKAYDYMAWNGILRVSSYQAFNPPPPSRRAFLEGEFLGGLRGG
jgi:hypothetical protein